MPLLKNKKHERLVQEYLIDLNQTQAAIRAGYSPLSAPQQASEILKIPKVRARVDELMAERSKRTGVNADRVVRELARLAFVNATDVFDVRSATLREDVEADDTAAIQAVKVKVISGDVESEEREIKLADKTRSLELLGKHLGMFTDRFSIEGQAPVVIVDDLRDDGPINAIGFDTGSGGDEE